MSVIRSCCFFFGLLAVASSLDWVAAAAHGEPSGDSFSNGMHAYYAGNSADAESLFAQAIGVNPNDPRSHYFLGLCLLRQGRSDEARAEMSVGAALEARSPGSYAVGKSLERIQGGNRLLLEGFRRRARSDRAIARNELKRALYRTAVATPSDAAELRKKVSLPLDHLVQPVALAEWSRAAIETTPSTAAIASESQSPVAATEHVERPVADPFADDLALQPEGKIPSGKLMGIVGRAIVESAPVPSLDSLRGYLQKLPIPSRSAAEPGFAPAEDSDPFAEPMPAQSTGEGTGESKDSLEEDPFGGF